MEAAARIRLHVAGVDTLALSALCARCPQGPRGCCAAPPVFTWSDLARILAHGGQAWLRGEVAARRLLPNRRGLAVARVEGAREGEAQDQSGARCVFHGPRGCTIDAVRRSATCNDYLCDDALADGGGETPALAARAGAVHGELAATYARWDETIAEAIGTPCWDGAAGEEAMLAVIAGYAARVRASLPRRLRG